MQDIGKIIIIVYVEIMYYALIMSIWLLSFASLGNDDGIYAYRERKSMKESMIGVIGTLLGTILGWVLNSLSQKGKTSIFVNKWKQSFKYNNSGFIEECPIKDKVEFYSYDLQLDIYNSSGKNEIIRDVRIMFFNNDQLLFSNRPKDDSTRRVNGHMTFYEELESFNIPPNCIIPIHLRGGFNKSEECFDSLWEANKILLTYKNSKNKDFRVVLSREKLNDYFNKHHVLVTRRDH